VFCVAKSSIAREGTSFGVPLRYQLSEDLVKTWRSHKWGFGANFEREVIGYSGKAKD